MTEKVLHARIRQLENENEKLKGIIYQIWLWAKRYCDGRMSYVVQMYNDAMDEAMDLGMTFSPDNDGRIKARDGMWGER